MIEISQEDFEKKVQDIIDGKLTRVELITELKTDRTTLNNRIQELSLYNPELYRAFVTKYPYRPRQYTHINYEAVIIEILKKGYKRRELDDIYGIDSRTISRHIHIVQEKNPDLVELYREVSEYRKKQKTIPAKLQAAIDMLEEKEVFLGGVCDKKREELVETERQYTKKLIEGIKATKASEELGTKRVSKKIDTLNRIDLERQIINSEDIENKKGEIE